MSRSTRHIAAIVLLLTLVLTLSGVTPGEAARSARQALNADAVDGLSAAKRPRPGQLLALDRDGRYPASVIPPNAGARGPRGPSGPPGATGEPGPSAGYLDRNDAILSLTTVVPIPVVELRLPAGAYALDFAAHTYLGDPASTFVDCTLDADRRLAKTAVMVGTAAEATLEAVIVMTEGVVLGADTTVRVSCSERTETNVRLTDARLRAIRLGTLVEQ